MTVSAAKPIAKLNITERKAKTLLAREAQIRTQQRDAEAVEAPRGAALHVEDRKGAAAAGQLPPVQVVPQQALGEQVMVTSDTNGWFALDVSGLNLARYRGLSAQAIGERLMVELDDSDPQLLRGRVWRLAPRLLGYRRQPAPYVRVYLIVSGETHGN